MPEVSILIPTYNIESHISKTLDSVIQQTFDDWEMVILDDCSIDDTYEICRQYAMKDPRIRLFRNETNQGMMKNWNKGITMCGGLYWGKLDHDDIWSKNMLQDCVNILRDNESVGLVVTNYSIIDESGNLIKRNLKPDQEGEINCKELIEIGGVSGMFRDNLLMQGIGLMRREIFDKIGKFRMFDPADTEMWFRVGCHYRIHYINRENQLHRKWSRGFTSSYSNHQGRQERNIFLATRAILNYYFKHRTISRSLFEKLSSTNRLRYNLFLTSYYRIEKTYKLFWKYFCWNVRYFPLRIISFYMTRLISKIK